MTTLPPINYTDREYATIFESVRTYIRRKFPSDWKDWDDANVGVAIAQILAWSHDVLSYMLDRTAREGFLATARDRSSIILLGQLVGYQLRAASAASVEVTCTLAVTEAVDILIPAGTAFTTASGVAFEFLSEGVIPAGELSAKVFATQGETRTDTFTSDGSVYQKFRLSEAEVIRDSIIVEVNDVVWTRVDSLVYGDENSTVYTVAFDESQFATIQFGDGVNGYLPTSGSAIVATYRVGGGVQGNIALDQIEATVIGQRAGSFPVETVEVALTNPDERGSGGNPPETNAEAKFNIPRWVSTNGRAVTRQDYETLAALFSDPVAGAPSRAAARLHQRVPESNLVDIFLWSRDSEGHIAEAGSALIAAVQAYFDNNDAGAVRMVCTDAAVASGILVYIDISLRVKVGSSFASSSTLVAVLASLDEFFDDPELQPGTDVRRSLVYRDVQATAGVDYSEITLLRASLKVTEAFATLGDGTTTTFVHATEELPILGTVVITAGDQVATDASGELEGNLGSGISSIDYETGDIVIDWEAAPPNLTEISIEYRYVITYQRGELELVANGTATRFRGLVDFPPVLPGSFAITDGSQVAIDDGDGNLTGSSLYGDGPHTIDYDTGAYDVTFITPPVVGAEIRTLYLQFLQGANLDLPIVKNQMPVKGIVTVAAIGADATD